ncbi:hypothetical protein Bca101_082395 [Brassica carinata]
MMVAWILTTIDPKLHSSISCSDTIYDFWQGLKERLTMGSCSTWLVCSATCTYCKEESHQGIARTPLKFFLTLSRGCALSIGAGFTMEQYVQPPTYDHIPTFSCLCYEHKRTVIRKKKMMEVALYVSFLAIHITKRDDVIIISVSDLCCG